VRDNNIVGYREEGVKTMSINLNSSLKNMVEAARDYRYHRFHTIQATGILKGIERKRGKINNYVRRLCNEYATEVLGHKHFAPWLYVYSAISGEFKEGWIPDNYYGSVVVPKLKGHYGKISSLKPLNSVIFKSNLFPDVLSYVNGIFFDTQYRFVSMADVIKIIFKDKDRVIFKSDKSLQGRGIHFFNRDTFNVEQIQRIGNGLFQTYIKQHGVFTMFAADSVATIRITTVYKDDGEVTAKACYLRFGSGTDTHVQSKSHIRVPIDLKTGAFNEVGYTPEWSETKVHPTCQLEFANNIIPNFRECIDTVKVLHKKVPYARCIGWDVTVDHEEKVKIMEWNAEHNDIKFSEATQGPCFADLNWEQLTKEAST